MTQIRAKTLEMIEKLPDDAFSTLMKYHRTLPEDFDYKAELERAKEESGRIM